MSDTQVAADPAAVSTVSVSTVSVSTEDWEIWRAFRSMTRQLERSLDSRLQRTSGLSQADYSVLLALFETPEKQLRVGELAEFLVWEKSRLSHQIARMETRGFVTRRECNSDGRGTWVGISANGKRALLSAMRDHTAAVQDSFFGQLSGEERDVLHRVSARIIEHLNPVPCDELED